MKLKKLVDKYLPDRTIPLLMVITEGEGLFSGPNGIKGKWSDYKEDSSKVILLSDDEEVVICPRKNLIDGKSYESIEYQENRMRGDRYDLDEAYSEGFFGWDNNAPQQVVLAQYFVPRIIEKFKPKYVLDIGCGTGQWLDEYRNYDVLTKGVEGSVNAFIEMSEETKKIVLKWDLRDEIKERDYSVDFVQSFEVAEHVEEE